jgi:hypothetical protein
VSQSGRTQQFCDDRDTHYEISTDREDGTSEILDEKNEPACDGNNKQVHEKNGGNGTCVVSS